jgi:DNA-binding MarR family transcriptional regulator
MTIDQTARIVQMAYPQVYLACHTRHQRKRSTDHGLSQRDAAILAHLDEARPTAPSQLARHLGVSRSTASEALKRLAQLGFVARGQVSNTGRSTAALLSSKGARAIRDTSVLETARLRAALSRATVAERRAIAAGLTQLARVCRTLSDAGAA